MKQIYALVPSEREKECKHTSGFPYRGRMPCTGVQRCYMCGMLKEDYDKEAGEVRR